MIGRAMRGVGSYWQTAFALLVGAGAIGSTGCVADLWPLDRVETEPGACHSTRRAPELDAGGSGDQRIVIEETDDEAPVVDLAVEGRGEDFVGRVRLSHGVGTVELGCDALPVATYSFQESEGDRVFRALAVARDRLYLLRWVCASGKLNWVWFLGTDGTPWTPEAASGSCTEFTAPTRSSRVHFPPIDMPLPRGVAGFTIAGPEISLGSEGRGSITLNAVASELFAFHTDSCGENCNEQWRRFDTLIWDRAGRRVSYAQLIRWEQQAAVYLAEGITLPGFVDDVGSPSFDATLTEP